MSHQEDLIFLMLISLFKLNLLMKLKHIFIDLVEQQEQAKMERASHFIQRKQLI
jgi:hypothetical protein